MLSMTDQLKTGTELQKRMLTYSGGKEAFAALQRINKAKIKERDDREYQVKYQAVRQLLQERDFDQLGIGILEHHKITDQFTYHGNMVQIAQLKHIGHFFNDVGAFEKAVDQRSDLQQIVDHAVGFGRLSNQANRSNNISLSQACLEIGRNILALGKGLKNGLERNVTGLYHLVLYPVDTGEDIGHLIKTIGTGIGKLVTTSIKMDVGMALEDENLIRSAQQDVDNWIDGGRQLYEVGKQTWQSKSKLERYELTGSIASDFLLAKGMSWLVKLGSLKNLTSYKPQAFAKLGEVGREINQIVGLTCAKVPKYLRKSEQLIAAGEAALADLNLIEELNALNLLKHEAQIANSATKVNELTKIVEFEKNLLALQVEYGTGILHDAKQALRINNYKIINCHEAEILNKLKQACADIKYIQSRSHRYNFIYDVAQGGATDGSIAEALVACAAEDQGIVKKLMRSAETAYDFLDELGNKWDIKTFKSKYMISDKSYKEFINKSKIDISKGEYILFNVTEASEESVNKLKNFINLTLSEQEKNKITFIRY